MGKPRQMPKLKQSRRTRPTQRSELEEGLLFQMTALSIQPADREYRFSAHHVGLGPGIKTRLSHAGLKDWRFDFAWPDLMFAVEVDGGGWVQGGHNTGVGSDRDMKKGHHAARLGWFVYRCHADLIHSGLAVMFIESWIEKEQARRQGFDNLLEAWCQRAAAGQEDANEVAHDDPGGAKILEQSVLATLNCRSDLKRLLKQKQHSRGEYAG